MIKDIDFDVGGAKEIMDKAVVNNAIKILSFNGKKFDRAVFEKMQAGNMILELDTQYDIEETSISIERDEVSTIMNWDHC